MADVSAIRQSENRFVYTPCVPLLTFREKGPNGRNCIKYPDAENPTGEWNVIDLYCLGDSSVHVVNGKVTMVLYNLRHVENEREVPLTRGKIQLQSEGAELFYRNIMLEPISSLPKNLIN